MPTLRILALGHSGVGKTTYLASMFWHFQTPWNGFTLSTADRDAERMLMSTHQEISRGRYPVATSAPTSYTFTLAYNTKIVTDVVWSDYRGGAIWERSVSSEKAELVKQLSAADGILVFVDATSGEEPDTLDEIGVMTNMLGNNLPNVSARKALALVFTKCDLFPSREGAAQKLLAVTAGLRGAIASSGHLLGIHVPIACGPEPYRIPDPIVFTLRTALNNYRNTLITQGNEHAKCATEYFSKATLWNELFGAYPYRYWAQSHATSMQQRYDEADPFDKPIEEMNAFLKDMPVF